MKIEKLADVFYLKGPLNEKADFSEIFNSQDELLKLDFSGVFSVNSVGIQILIKELQKWGKKRTYEFWNCRVVLIDQLETNEALLQSGIGKVNSVIIDFCCLNCGFTAAETVQCLDLKNWNDNGRYPKKKCPSCGIEGEFEPVDDPFYAFLEDRNKYCLNNKNSKRVLLAEDDEDIVEIIVKAFEPFSDIEVFVAKTGLEAKKFLEEDKFDLFLCDLHMPPLNGLSLIKQFRKSVDIFVVSGTPDLKEESMELGAKKFISKPISIPSFVSTVRTHLGFCKLDF